MKDKKAIRVLENIDYYLKTHTNESCEEEHTAINLAIKALEERPQGEWIPVSERLPDDMQKVLVWFEYYRYGDYNCMYQTYGFGYFYDGKWSSFINGETGWQDARIIAWMPLPEPYKEDDAENESNDNL